MSSQITIAPVVKRARRGSKTTTTKRSKKFPNIQRNLVSVGRGFPKTVRTTLRYSDYKAVAALGTGTTSYQTWKCNGLYDPEDAVGGHQPYGYDQYAALYLHYWVTAARCIVKFCLQDDAGVVAGNTLVGLNVIPSSTDSDGVSTKMEKANSNAKYQWLGDGSGPKTITETWSAKRYFDSKDPTDNSQLKGTTAGTDPSELSHFEVWYYNASGGSIGLNFTITIEYDVIFSEEKQYGGS